MQLKLLEAAIHATKIGGRIVYSTCTLTPEENEEVVMEIMTKFGGKLEVLDPEKLKMENGKWKMDSAIDDSGVVQKHLAHNSQFSILNFSFLRLWPQTYDTEGFFCAVLQKKSSTRDVLQQEYVQLRGELTPSRTKDIAAELIKRYGASFMHEDERCYETAQYVTLLNDTASKFQLPCPRYAFGLPFLKLQKDSRIRLTHEMITLRGKEATKGVMELMDAQKEMLLQGKDTPCDSTLHGELILRWHGISIGMGLAKEGVLKNWIPRSVVKQISP